MAEDAFGNIVTASDPAGLAAIDDFVLGLLGYHPRAANVLAAAEARDAPVLVHVYAGFIRMFAEAPGADRAALPHLDAARAAAPPNAREAMLIDALDAWIADDIDRAIDVLGAALAAYPRDLATLKLLHYHQFNHGDFPAMLRAAELAIAADPDLPYASGMLAFAHEQLHLLDDAERAARHALAILPGDPWAQHAIAHVVLTQGRIAEGVSTLERWAPGWEGLNSFAVTHLWWHLALLYLAQGRAGDALAAYDDHVWRHARDYSQDQIGAVSLLARLELAGVDVGDRWAELGGYLAARAGDVVQPFLSVQYLYGLARAGLPEADALLAAIATVARDGPAHSRDAWTRAGLPLAEGLVAHARGDFDTAAHSIGDALPHLLRLGGSHAQRDLFDQILLDANIRSGRLIVAQQALEQRRAHDPDDVPVNRMLADVYRALGLPRQAAQARARIERRRAA